MRVALGAYTPTPPAWQETPVIHCNKHDFTFLKSINCLFFCQTFKKVEKNNHGLTTQQCFIFILQSYIHYDHLDTTLVLFSSMLIEFLLLRLWNSRYHLFWLRSMLSYVITLPSIKFLCIVVCLFVVLSGVFSMLLSVFLRPMTFDNPSTPQPGQRFVIILKVSKNTKKKSFHKNYSFGTSRTSTAWQFKKQRGLSHFWKSIAKIDIPPSFNKVGHFLWYFISLSITVIAEVSSKLSKTLFNDDRKFRVATKFLWELAMRK